MTFLSHDQNHNPLFVGQELALSFEMLRVATYMTCIVHVSTFPRQPRQEMLVTGIFEFLLTRTDFQEEQFNFAVTENHAEDALLCCRVVIPPQLQPPAQVRILSPAHFLLTPCQAHPPDLPPWPSL